MSFMRRSLLVAALSLAIGLPAFALSRRITSADPCYLDAYGSSVCPEPQLELPYPVGWWAAFGFIIDGTDDAGNIVRWSELTYGGWTDQFGRLHVTNLGYYCSDPDAGCIARDMVMSGWRPSNWEGGW